MPKIAKSLSPLEVRRLTKPGLHAVGEVSGLCLQVKTTGARSWILRTVVGGRRCEIGLGGYPTTTISAARELAREHLLEIRRGADPVATRLQKRRRSVWTFEKVAAAYIDGHRAEWKNAKHAAQWESTLSTYVYPVFGHKHVADVTKVDVLAVIEPIWLTKNETASRLRGRIETVLTFAMQREYRPEGVNPAALSGLALARASKVAPVEHHAAIDIDGMYDFMQRLRKVEGMGARALQFVILTAARSGEVRGATWQEIDLDAALWTIPKERMKGGRAHRVPLSPEAVTLLKALPRFEGCELVFPGTKNQPLSDMTLTAVMRRMKVDAVPHGMRSAFRDWCGERTATPNEVAELCLAHAIGNETEAAYRRGDMLDRRREVMELWARFIDTPPAKGNVVTLPARSAA
ncbi:MAG: integrase arm-type DNA-binding domain-containing protein [Burkholderiaceae bacterium]|nr:integrase arm-type DNA-binding domain-containing protein [Burkholderiaceae bacterium]